MAINKITYDYSTILHRQKRQVFVGILILVTALSLIGYALFLEVTGHTEDDITHENVYSANLVYRSLKNLIGVHEALTKRLSEDETLIHLTVDLIDDYESGQNLLNSESLAKARELYKAKNVLNSDGYYIIAPDYTSLASSRDFNIATKNIIAIHSPRLLERAFLGESVLVPPIESGAPLPNGRGELVTKSETIFSLSPIIFDGAVVAVLAVRLPMAYIIEQSFQLSESGLGISKETNLFSANGVLTDESFGLVYPHGELRRLPEYIDNKINNYNAGGVVLWGIFDYKDNHDQQVGGTWLWDPVLGIGVVSEYSLTVFNERLLQVNYMFVAFFSLFLFSVISFMLLYSRQSAKISEALHLSHKTLESYAKEQTKEIKSAYLVLEESKNNLEQVINSGPDAMIGVDENGMIILVNHQTTCLFGYDEASFIGMMLGCLLPESSKLGHEKNIRTFLDDTAGKVLNMSSVTGKHRSGREFSADIKIVSINFYDRKIAIANIRDMTKSRILEQRLRENESLYRMIFSSSPLAMCRFNSLGHVVAINNMFEKIVGVEVTSIGAAKIQDFFAGSSEHLQVICVSLEGHPGTFVGEHSNLSSNKKYYIQAIYNPVRDDGKAPAGAVVAILDLTAQRVAEIERDNLGRELSKAHKMESIGVLAGGVAHEFNNMLSPIIGYSEMIKEDIQGSEFYETVDYIDNVLKSAKVASEIVHQLLTFSREETGKNKIINPVAVVKETIKLLQPTIVDEINLDFGHLNESVLIVVDPVRFHQCFVDLLINAKDSIDGQGNITVSIIEKEFEQQVCCSCYQEVAGRYVAINVKDSGCGISAEQINNIFDPFFSTKDVKRGTGLGLSITHGVMHTSHGHIMIDSTPGQGTEMSLLFPVVAHDEQTPGEAEGIESVMLGGCANIMVVDGDASITKYMSLLLSSYGYNVDAFNKSEEAWEAYIQASKNYDLIISDVVMPGMSGLDLVGKVRGQDGALPIILMSGYNSDVNENNVDAYEANAFLLKPITNWRLLYKIREMIRKDM